MEYRPFKEARKFVRSLSIRDTSGWEQYSKSRKRPADIPSHPNFVYKNQKWKGYGDWLGTGRVAYQNVNRRSYQEARKFVRSLELKNQQEWNTYCKSGKKPNDIPSDPSKTVAYKKQWKGWGDWLGTYYVANQRRDYLDFDEARKFAQNLKLRNRVQ